MWKPVALTCVAFLVAGLIGVGGLYAFDDPDIAIGGFIIAGLLQIVAIWGWRDNG
jgi:hypothetical protein